MIAGRCLPSCIVASPERVARDILRAVRTGRDVLYTPGWWRPSRVVPRPAGVCGEAFEAVGEEGRAGRGKLGGRTFAQKGFSSSNLPSSQDFRPYRIPHLKRGMGCILGEKLLIRRGLLGTIIMFLYFIVFIEK